MNKLHLNNDYCYSLEDLRAIIKRCATIGPELDNPLIIELLCALKDGHLKEFLEAGNSEEQLLAEKLPDYRLYNSDDNLYNAICRCFDDSYEMGKISIFDYIELVSVHGKIGDGETKEFLPNQQIEVQEGINPIVLEAKFKVKKHVNLQLDFYLQYIIADRLIKSDITSINLMDYEEIVSIPLSVDLQIKAATDQFDLNLNIGRLNEWMNMWHIVIKGPMLVIPVKDGVCINMVKVQGGEITRILKGTKVVVLGGLKEVILPDYYIAETLVTGELWHTVMGENVDFCGSQEPIEMSYHCFQEFIVKLNKLTGMNFRFPTEIEWEYAARGGNKSQGYEYAGSNDICDVAWYAANSDIKVHPVKHKHPNELGLYDMSGNLWEWCDDWYTDMPCLVYPVNYVKGAKKVCRGGCKHSAADSCRVSNRDGINPEIYQNVGLRLALSTSLGVVKMFDIAHQMISNAIRNSYHL